MEKTKVYDYMLSVLDKAENGPILEEKEWDRQYINQSVKDLIKKYDIQWQFRRRWWNLVKYPTSGMERC